MQSQWCAAIFENHQQQTTVSRQLPSHAEKVLVVHSAYIAKKHIRRPIRKDVTRVCVIVEIKVLHETRVLPSHAISPEFAGSRLGIDY